jgi:5-methylcytosine-specific restriction endonuclease McrA
MIDEVVMRHCGRCKADFLMVYEVMQTGPHYAKLICPQCRGVQWMPKPDTDPTKYTRPAAHTDLVEKYSRGFCELCLREKGELRKRDTFMAHHVWPFKYDGSEGRENIWILCTACHRLVEWQRTYHGTVRDLMQLKKP